MRVLWVLLRFGYLSTDVDSCGNNALHLAAAGGEPEVHLAPSIFYYCIVRFLN